MEISKRLQAVAAYVPADAVLADIGTDHAFLPIWLIRQQRIREAYACDVKTGPLERARQHVTEAGLEDAVHLCLSDGLEALSDAHMTTVAIAGMGGYLTAQILLRDHRLGAPVLRKLTDLILQPQSEWGLVRQTVHACGFCIAAEQMVEERGKFYLILHSRPGEERYSETEYEWGRLLSKEDPVFRLYLEREEQKLAALLEQLSREETETARLRCGELRRQQEAIREVWKR